MFAFHVTCHTLRSCCVSEVGVGQLIKHCKVSSLVSTQLQHVNTPGPHRPVELGEDNRSVCIEMERY